MMELLKWSIKESALAIGSTLVFIIAVAAGVMPMFGIAWLIDTYNLWWSALFIPYIALLSMTLKEFGNV